MNQQQFNITSTSQGIRRLNFQSIFKPADQEKSNVKIQVNVRSESLGQDHYKVILSIQATGSRESDSKVFFKIDLDYEGEFKIVNAPKNELELVLMIYCPTVLFPFARRIVADATTDGGFKPLLLNMIDFVKLHEETKKDS